MPTTRERGTQIGRDEYGHARFVNVRHAPNDMDARELSQRVAREERFDARPGRLGSENLRDYSYAMIMEVDGRVELSGQGGWDTATLEFSTERSIEAEINQAFDNVAFMLNAAGLDWKNVAHVNSYHVPEPDGSIFPKWPASSAGVCLTINR